jgi:hypothetical protein
MIRALPDGFELDDGPARVWILHTTGAHGLYEQFGFGGTDPKVMERLP